MYRLLIVDDEEIEREGMANYINWEAMDIQLVGTAWNGVEGFEKIEKQRPDIVLTDIKMPFMDGIQLIRKTKAEYPEIEFVVLSGYGEYEFTSQAMEEGVRHYLLKPCDEDKIGAVLNKIKNELQKKAERKQTTVKYETTVHKLLPLAKEQLFRDMLFAQEINSGHYQLFRQQVCEEKVEIILLAFYREKGFDLLENFILGNVLTELLGTNQVLLSANVKDIPIFLVKAVDEATIQVAIHRVQEEFQKFSTEPMLVVLTERGYLQNLNRLYGQVQGMIRINSAEKKSGFCTYSEMKSKEQDFSSLINYKGIQESKTYSDLLLEIYLLFVKMELAQYTFEQKEKVCIWIIKFLYGTEYTPIYTGEIQDRLWYLIEITIEEIKKYNVNFGTTSKSELRMQKILLSIFRYIRMQDLNIQFLAKEILYMNEEHFGRIFTKHQGMRFSTYLMTQRTQLAKRLWQHNPELKVQQIAELVGYSPDGQYFSKVFHKTVGISPTEYRLQIKK